MMITFYKSENDGSLRYYSVHDRQSHLFSRYSFSAIYGIDQSTGRERVFTFKTRREMDDRLREIFRERIEKGYKVLYSYAKKRKYQNMFSKIIQSNAG